MLTGDQKSLYLLQKGSGIDLTTDTNIIEAWNNLRSSNDTSINWLLITIKDGTSTANLLSSGNNGINEMISCMNDDNIYYGSIKINLKSGGSKYYHLSLIGSNVSGMKKGKSSMYKAGIFKYLDGNHGELPSFIDGITSISIDIIIEQVIKLSRIDINDIVL